MKRELPIYNIEGTDFIVDVENLQLKEKARPDNTIRLVDMWDAGNGYSFEYSRRTKNLPVEYDDNEMPVGVKIPELVKLDPIGMADKYGYSLLSIQGKSDFAIMVDQQALGRRLRGQLPTLEVAGHTFVVNMAMNRLYPKDGFITSEISFAEIEHYYDLEQHSYIVPYNLQTKQFVVLDSDKVTSFPEHMVPVSFPHERILDPVGYNREYGLDESHGLKFTNIKSHFEAKIVDWKDTHFLNILKKNINQQQQQHKKNLKTLRAKNRQRRSPKL